MSDVATARRARASRQLRGELTSAEREASAEREGAIMGAKLRGRTAAHGVLETAAMLAAEGIDLSAEAADEIAEARAELEGAEDAARASESVPLLDGTVTRRNVGRWVVATPRYMSHRDLATTAKIAARAAARQMRAAGMPRLTDDELADLESDLLLVALERGKSRGGLQGGLPAWRAIDADDGNYRAAWRNFLTAHARTFARKRAEAYKAAKAAQEAPTGDERRAERAEARSAEASALVDAMAERLTLSTAERQAITAAIDGLTHRERAAAEGIDPNTAKQRAKRGRRLLTERWPSAIALRSEVIASERAAREAEGPLPPHARTAWAEAMGERTALELMSAERAARHVPHGWLQVHGWRGLDRKVPRAEEITTRGKAA